LLLSGALCASPCVAQEAASAPVDEVIVTATRLPSLLEEAPGARVVEEAEIERRGAVFAADVLETVPGVNIARNGGFGGVTYVRQRGQGSDKTLVLVDGVPLNDPSQPAGGFDFSSFELADVERVEVLSGPQGSLWGSDAIGGVISFTTRELDGLRGDLEAGSYGTVRGSAAAGRATDAYAYGLALSGFTSDGISKAAVGTEEDGFDSRTVSLNGRYRATDRITLDGRVRYNEARAEIDGYDAGFAFGDTPEVYETETASAFARARASGVAGFDHAVSISALHSERTGSGGLFPYAYEAERRVYRYVAERGGARSPYGLAFGVEREDTSATLNDGAEADLGATAAFGVLRLVRGALTLNLSGRYDDPDRYDAQATGRASAVYDLSSGFSLSAAYGQGFRTPSISQAVCDFCFPAGPSDLRPERAQGADLGLAWASAGDRFTAALTAYRLEVRDQIEFVFGPDFSSRYENIAETLTRGVEAEAAAVLGGGVSVRAAYAYTDAENRSTGGRLLRVPEHQGSAVLSWEGERVDATFTLRAESDQADSDPSTFTPALREGFVTADLAASYAVTEGVRATLRLENLFDRAYQQALGYAEPGRSAYVGLRLRR
jgi:vitamin B12 transporter